MTAKINTPYGKRQYSYISADYANDVFNLMFSDFSYCFKPDNKDTMIVYGMLAGCSNVTIFGNKDIEPQLTTIELHNASEYSIKVKNKQTNQYDDMTVKSTAIEQWLFTYISERLNPNKSYSGMIVINDNTAITQILLGLIPCQGGQLQLVIDTVFDYDELGDLSDELKAFPFMTANSNQGKSYPTLSERIDNLVNLDLTKVYLKIQDIKLTCNEKKDVTYQDVMLFLTACK